MRDNPMTNGPKPDYKQSVDYTSQLELKDIYTLYEGGKGRRYGLLFSVNGAAFAIISFTIKEVSKTMSASFLPTVAGIMSVFTLVMACDIWRFGKTMADLGNGKLPIFRPGGRVVLVSISVLLICGWAGAVYFAPRLTEATVSQPVPAAKP